jgi:nucleoid-associated protein EbfC
MEINLTDIMKQVQNIQSQAKDVQEKLSRLTVTSESGGGMVTVTITGRQEIKDIKLDPICVDPRDVPMLEALIIAAVNQGIKKSKELSSDEMKKLTGGIALPFDLS